MAVTIVTIVGAALTTYLGNTVRLVGAQVDQQAASHFADAAIEQVRALKVPVAGGPPALPATTTNAVNGVTYTQTWSATACGRSTAGNVPCDSVASGDITYYRVVVTVTWRGRCPGGSCSVQTSALLNTNSDPKFDPT